MEKRILGPLIFMVALGCGVTFGDSVRERVEGRGFPSVFQAWNGAEVEGVDRREVEARHDLIFHAADYFGLKWEGESAGSGTGFVESSVERGLERREELLGLNPAMVVLCEIRYRDAHTSFLPEGHRWWKRDGAGKRVVGWEEGGYFLLDFGNAEYRDHVAKRCGAAVRSGVFDGVMLDWWEEDEDRVALVKRVRAEVGEDALILVNANDRKTPKTAEFINGHFMECYRSGTAEDWGRIEESLRWAEAHVRKPRVNCLETWFEKSRGDLHRMRATTTLGLVASDGYVLFSDPNELPTGDHLHDWYAFWDVDLGVPAGAGVVREDGLRWREFSNGVAVYNPPGGKEVRVEFESDHRSVATGKVGGEHTVGAFDGDLFLKLE